MNFNKIKMKKRGNIGGILIFFVALFILLFCGFAISMFVVMLDWLSDDTLPELENLGETGSVNLTKIGDLTVRPTRSFIDALPGIVGVLYIMGFAGILGLSFMFRNTEQRWLLFLFFGLTVMLVIAGIVISVIYEDFYNDSGAVGDRLKDQTLMSFLILYSPALMVMISAIGAIIMFSGGGGPEI